VATGSECSVAMTVIDGIRENNMKLEFADTFYSIRF